MIRCGAVLVGCGLLALLAATIVQDKTAVPWLITAAIGCTVAGVAMLVTAPYSRAPLRVQLVRPDPEVDDERQVLARELLDALDAANADRVDRS